VQAQLGNQSLELAVLLLQLFQPLRLVHLQATIFLAPAVVGLVHHSGSLSRRRSRLAVCHRHFNLANYELANYENPSGMAGRPASSLNTYRHIERYR
jgi:hypothetical protein